MKAIFLLFLLSLTLISHGQQDPAYTQYMNNLSVVNPAYAGSKEAISIGFLARKQWVGVTGSPATFTAYIHSPIGKNVGLGFSLISDKVGPINESNVYTDFSYTIQVSENSKLAFGLKSGLTIHDIGILSLTQVDQNDPLYLENVSNTYFNMGFGLFYYGENKYFGFSIPNILKARHFERNKGVITDVSDDMHNFITGGFVMDINRNLKFKPSFLTKFALQTPLSVDISTNFLFKEKVEFGMSYRWGDSVSGLLNFKINTNTKIGYAYDYTTSNLSDFSSGTHEVIILFDIIKPSKKYTSIRFF